MDPDLIECWGIDSSNLALDDDTGDGRTADQATKRARQQDCVVDLGGGGPSSSKAKPTRSSTDISEQPGLLPDLPEQQRQQAARPSPRPQPSPNSQADIGTGTLFSRVPVPDFSVEAFRMISSQADIGTCICFQGCPCQISTMKLYESPRLMVMMMMVMVPILQMSMVDR